MVVAIIFLFSQESERAGEVGLFLTETYGQEVSKFNTFTDFLSFLVTGTPDPELVDVDYDEIVDIIEDSYFNHVWTLPKE
jgi:hypothetical protein